jgi:peptidoglycan hydrolase-like protein with peptidoglycan-binding domain
MIDAPYTGVDVRIDSWSPTTTEGDLAFIGAIDIAQLGKALPATPEPTLYYKVPNMFGVPVILVQNRLCAKGLRIRLAYPGCPTGVDGQFGMRTSVAVKLFQTKEKIGVDGIVGSETWQALGL